MAPSGQTAALDALVARFLDEQLLKAVSLVNMDRKQVTLILIGAKVWMPVSRAHTQLAWHT